MHRYALMVYSGYIYAGALFLSIFFAPRLDARTSFDEIPTTQTAPGVIIQLKSTTQASQFRLSKVPSKFLKKGFTEYKVALNGVFLKNVSLEEARLQFRNDPEVAAVHPNVIVRTNLNTSRELTQAHEIGAYFDTSGKALEGTGITIGVLDTGVDYTHPDLGGCFGPTCKVIGGYDFINNDSNPMDDNGHGTHVAATAAGNGHTTPTSGSSILLTGVAPGASIVAYKVLDKNGTGSSATILSAIERCADPNSDGDSSDHLDICTLSLGGSGNPDDIMSRAVDTASSKGVIFTIAAGNSGPSVNTIGSPGTARSAITVAAACRPSQVGTTSTCATAIAQFSSQGPVTWSTTQGTQTLTKPDVAAPGVGICAARTGGYQPDRTCYDSSHISISGTSMATPHVAGLVALLKQAHPTLTPELAKQTLKSTALNYGLAETIQGKGHVQGLQALSQLGIPGGIRVVNAPIVIVDSFTKLKQTVNGQIQIQNTSSASLTLNASISEPPAGYSFQFSQPSLTLAAGGTGTINFSVTIDHEIVKSLSQLNARIQLAAGTKSFSIPVLVSSESRVTLSLTSFDYGTNYAANSQFSRELSLVIKNKLTDSSTPVAFTTNYSFNNDGSPIVLSYSQSSLTLPSQGQQTIYATLAMNNSAISNGRKSGTVQVSAGLDTFNIPFTVFKGYTFRLNYGSPPPAWVVPMRLGSVNSLFITPTASDVDSVLQVTEAGPWIFHAEWAGDPTQKIYSYSVLKELVTANQEITNVSLNRNEAIFNLEVNPKGPSGSNLSEGVFGYAYQVPPEAKSSLFLMGQAPQFAPDYKIKTSTFGNAYRFFGSILGNTTGNQDVLNYSYELKQLNSNHEFTNAPTDIKEIPLWVPYNVNYTGNLFAIPVMTFGGMQSSVSAYSRLVIPAQSPAHKYYFYGNGTSDLDSRSISGYPTIAFDLASHPTGYSGSMGRVIITSNRYSYRNNRLYFKGLGTRPALENIISLGRAPFYDASQWNLGGLWGNLATPRDTSIQLTRRTSDHSYELFACGGQHAALAKVTYTLKRNGTLISSGTRENACTDQGFSLPDNGEKSGSFEYEAITNPEILKQKTELKTQITFTLPTDLNSTPSLEDLKIRTLGVYQNTIDVSQTNQLDLTFRNEDLTQVKVSYSTTGIAYTEAPIQQIGVRHFNATLPANAGATRLYLRIIGQNSTGQMTQTFWLPHSPARTPVAGTVIDLINPTLTWKSPLPGSIQKDGVVAVEVNTQDNQGVVAIDYQALIDNRWTSIGSWAEAQSGPQAPKGVSLDISALKNGPVTLRAFARDAAGNGVASPDLSFSILLNDSTPPTVQVTSPLAGSTYTGNEITLTASASDNRGISEVEFFGVNSKITRSLGKDTTAPFSVTADITTWNHGPGEIYAKATDWSGLVSQSETVAITIDHRDRRPPRLTIMKPKHNRRLKAGRKYIFRVDVTDSEKVDAVDLYVGDQPLARITKSRRNGKVFRTRTRLPSHLTGTIELRAAAVNAKGIPAEKTQEYRLK